MTRKLIPLVAVALAAVAALPAAAARQSAAPTIEAVSTRAEYVSGGDVLVRVTRAARGHADRPRRRRRHLGVPRHARRLAARARRRPDRRPARDRRATGRRGRSRDLKVVNHPITGPLFSGPQQQPFFCETVPAGSARRSTPPARRRRRSRYRYRTTAGAFAVLADPTVRPADLAQTTRRRTHGGLRRPARAGHDRPRDLRARRAPRPGRAAEPVHGRAGLERAARLHVRRRLQRRLPPGPRLRRRAQRPLPRRAGTRSPRRA